MNMFKPTDAQTPEEYMAKLDDARRLQVQTLYDFIRKTIPGEKPHIMSGMIAFGKYHYKYSSGREGDWMPVALASQKNYISVYACGIDNGKYVAESYKDKLPRASIGKSCIRFKKVEDIDLHILAEILHAAVAHPMGKVEIKDRSK